MKCVNMCTNDGRVNECPFVPTKKLIKRDPPSYTYEFHPDIGVPQCVAEFDVQASTCSTCCCEDGPTKSSVHSRLVLSDGSMNCNGWFLGAADAFTRIFVGMYRTYQIITRLQPVCFSSVHSRDLGEHMGIGRRAGGGLAGAGSFSLSSGSNT